MDSRCAHPHTRVASGGCATSEGSRCVSALDRVFVCRFITGCTRVPAPLKASQIYSFMMDCRFTAFSLKEICQADLLDANSLVKAFDGADGVFGALHYLETFALHQNSLPSCA